MRGRVRWGNVGRAAGALAAVALAVAWPRLGGDAPVVPGDALVPVGTPPPPRRSAPAPHVVPTRPETAQGGEAAEAPRRRGRDRRPGPRAPAPVKPPTARPKPRAPVKPATPRPKPRVPRPEAPPAAVDAPPAAAAPVRSAPRPPAPTIDPAEREFGFER